MNRKTIIVIVACAWTIPAASYADTTRTVTRNPFERPPVEALVPNTISATDREKEKWSPELRAVLVAGAKSVANLGGIVLQVGETARGYQLISVGEDVATFERKGERIELSVYERDSVKNND